ncbi:MAG: hypothetical protein IKE93_08205 [Erysipelotrichaceae bacterium]|nr:hypothetical protein [Erysipelotrichaceae bacterium]
MNRLLENRTYQNLRTIIAAVAGLSLINIILIYFRIERNLAFSAFVPSWGMNYSVYLADESQKNLYIAVFGVGIIGLYVLCYVMSKKKAFWFMAALLMYLTDTWLMTYFIEQKGFSYSNWTFDIISHVFVLIIMTWAVVVAIRIKDDEAIKEMKTQPVMDFMLDDDTEKDFYMIDD